MPNYFDTALFSAFTKNAGLLKSAYVDESVVKKPKEPTIYDKAFKFDIGLGSLEVGASLFSAVQALNSGTPETRRTVVPTLNTPKIKDYTSEVEGSIKRNLATSVNTFLQRSKETGTNNLQSYSSIMSNANRVAADAMVRVGQQKQQVSGQNAQIEADVANRNAMMEFQANQEYNARREKILATDAINRGNQLSGAISNLGTISSRLLNDVIYKNVLNSSGNTSDSVIQKILSSYVPTNATP